MREFHSLITSEVEFGGEVVAIEMVEKEIPASSKAASDVKAARAK